MSFSDAWGASVTGNGAGLLSGRVFVPTMMMNENMIGVNVAFTTWAPDPEPVKGIANPALLRVTSTTIAPPTSSGGTVAVRVADTGAPVAVTTVVPRLPGLDPARPQLLVDYDAVSRRLIELGDSSLPITEWWAKVPPARAADYAKDLTDRGLGTATSRVGLGQQLQRQPLRVGIQGALWLLVVAAGAFAGVGFALHTTVSVRLRRVEFSQLRALGFTRRTLNAVVGVENLLLGLLGVGCGIGLGALLALLVAPMVSLTADGTGPIPPVLVHLPWRQVAALAGGVCAALAGILLIVTQALRTTALGAVLRLGDER